MELNIVLLGKTGHGKSATGNTLLDKSHFEEYAGPNSTTRMIERCFSHYKVYSVCVIDTPGPFDTNYNNKPDHYEIKNACDVMHQLMQGCSQKGVDAFFFVYNIGSSYTSEEEKSIEIYEKIFGEDIISDFGVLVFTHGDNFNKNFSQWCKIQTGPLRKLIEKFSERIILISNNGKDVDYKIRSRKAMMKQAKALKSTGNTYTFDDFEACEKSRQILIFREKLGDLKKKFKTEIDNLETQIKTISSLTQDQAIEYHKQILKIEAEINLEKTGTSELNGELEKLEKLKKHIKEKTKCTIL